MDQAATNGHLEVVQWLHNHRTEGCTVKAIDGAAANGQLAVVKWLHSHRSEGCTAAAMEGAVQHGHLEVLKFLLENYIDGYSEGAIDTAARGGHLEVVKWLHVQQAEEITPKTIEDAAKGGCTEVLAWLLQHYDRGADDSGEKLFMQMVCPLESAIMLYSDGRFAWEEGAIRSGFVSRDVEVSCWMWNMRPEDIRVTMESARDLVSRKCDEFEKIQDSVAPRWREWMVYEGPMA